MKQLTCSIICLVFLASISFAQDFTPAPTTTISMYGAGTIVVADSLLAMVHAKDSSSTAMPRVYVTPTMINNANWFGLHTIGTVSGGITIAPIATGTAVATIQNQNVAASVITLPSATCTLPGLGLANTWTSNQVYSGTSYSQWNGATSGGIKILPLATGTAVTTISNQNVAAATITLPSATTTLPGLSLNNVYTGTAEYDGSVSGGIKIAPIATGTALATLQNQNVSASTITLPSATCTLPGLGLTNAFTGANSFASTVTGAGGGNVVYHAYSRNTVTAINAAAGTGISLLAAVSGRQYRIINVRLTAYGGAFTSTNATSLEIVSDFGGTPVILYQVLKAQLVEGTAAGVGNNNMNPTTASTVILADGASFVAQVANKAITLVTTTASTYDWSVATGVDVDIEYVIQ